MPIFKVHVKWGKEKFKDVECNTDEPQELFRAQLFALSGVDPSRQKIMMKGTVIKDEDWETMKLKDGAVLLMMGTAEESIQKEPAQKPVFLEDMNESQIASAYDLPPGLQNLGNTCYMNATIQCLRTVPELQQGLKKFSGSVMAGGAMDSSASITAAMRDLFGSMDRTSLAIPPLTILTVLHRAFPQFAEKSEHGGFAQQDANECWTEIMRCLQQRVPLPSSQQSQASASNGLIDKYFGIEYDVTMKCVENEEEAEQTSTENQLQVSCFIEKDVKYLLTGLKSRLEETITKHSSSLSRDAVYKKVSRISRLPAYMVVQFVRFYYKGNKETNAKILKDIKFPMILDVFELCSAKLQEKLVPMRTQFKEQEDKFAEMDKDKKEAVKKEEVSTNKKRLPYAFPDDEGSNNSGYYELQAVLTHKGRSSASGHYVAWARRKGEDWLMFDDDNVVPMKEEDILKLSGGGDWHCAYVLLYGPRVLEVEAKSEDENGTKVEEKSESAMET